MAEIVEVFEDGAENVKKFVKKNPLVVAGLVVGGVALYVLWVKSRESSVDTTAYGAIGYGGYPVVGGGSSDSGESSDSYYEEILREYQSQNDSLISDISKENNIIIAELESTIGTLEERVTSSEERETAYQKQIARQNAISQMQANSELYNTITDRATKDALHAENVAIAEEMGWTFNEADGHYYENGVKVYTTAKAKSGQDTAYYGGKVSTAPSGSFVSNQQYNENVVNTVMKSTSKGYDPSVDYSAAITEAKKSGASQETIKALETARQNKINDQYDGKEPNMTGKDYTFSSTQK